jgi:hypothetical protein
MSKHKEGMFCTFYNGSLDMFDLMIMEGVIDQRQTVSVCEAEPGNFVVVVA